MATYDIDLLDDIYAPCIVHSGGAMYPQYIEKLSSNRAVTVFNTTDYIKQLRILELNKITGQITELSGLVFSTIPAGISWENNPPTVSIISETEFIVFWTGADNNGFCRTFQVDEITGVVSYWGAELEFSSTYGTYNSSVIMEVDSSYARILNVSGTAISETPKFGGAQIFTVDRTDGSITATGTVFQFDDGDCKYNSVAKISDTKVLNTYSGLNNNGIAIVLDINTSTWEVTAAGSNFTSLSTFNIGQNSTDIISQSPLVAVNGYSYNFSFAFRPLSINNTTWEVSNLGSIEAVGDFLESQNNQKRILLRIDDSNFISVYSGDEPDLFIETRGINTSNGDITSAISQVKITEIEFANYLTLTSLGDGYYIFSWYGRDGVAKVLKAQAFKLDLIESNIGTLRRRLI